MNDHQRDPELRALFEAQRRDDAANAPSFAELMSRARAAVPEAQSALRQKRRRREWAGGLAAAAAIAALILIPRLQSGDDAFEQAVRAFQTDPGLGAWQSPTASLLNMPGDGLLTTIPSVGVESQ